MAADMDRTVGIMVDLPGPKVRLGAFDGATELQAGTPIRLVPGRESSDSTLLGVDYQGLLLDVHPGDSLAVGDGSVTLTVESVGRENVEAVVSHGGTLQGRPGLHIPSDRLGMASPTTEDFRLLDAFIDAGVDMVALSFVRSGHDIRRVGTEPHPRGPLLVAKIETRAAVAEPRGDHRGIRGDHGRPR
ncbi:MAG: pyruvate kinase [Microthrixaceae bacterium]